MALGDADHKTAILTWREQRTQRSATRAMPGTEDARAAYQLSASEILASLATDAKQGLSTDQVRNRLQRYGPNQLKAETPVSGWRKFLRQFQDGLVILLLIATLVSTIVWLYERQSALPYEAITIFAI